jgi:hypothetical protein
VAAEAGGEIVILSGFDGSTFTSSVWATRDGRSYTIAGQTAKPERYPAIAVEGSTVYLFGGLVAGGEYRGTYDTTIQSFDVATGQSAVVGHLPVPLAHAWAAFLGGQLLVFGGWTPAGASNQILRFDPASGAVTVAGTLPEAVADEAVSGLGGPTATAVTLAAGLGAGERPLTAVVTVSAGG